jgi:hypothetical protein
VTVAHDSDGIREPIANSYSCNEIGFMTHLHSHVSGYVTCMQLMYVSPYAYVRLQFICIRYSQYVLYVLTLKVNFQIGCWIVTVYCVGERWHVLSCGTKKLRCGINL